MSDSFPGQDRSKLCLASKVGFRLLAGRIASKVHMRILKRIAKSLVIHILWLGHKHR